MTLWEQRPPECPREAVAEIAERLHNRDGLYQPLDAVQEAETRADHRTYRALARAWVDLFQDTARANRWIIPPGRSSHPLRWIDYAIGLFVVYGAGGTDRIHGVLREASRRQSDPRDLGMIATYGWLGIFGESSAAGFDVCMTMAEEWSDYYLDWLACAEAWSEFPGNRFAARIDRCLEKARQDGADEADSCDYWLLLSQGWHKAYRGQRQDDVRRLFGAGVARVSGIIDWITVTHVAFNNWPANRVQAAAYLAQAEDLAANEDDWLMVAGSWEWIGDKEQMERCDAKAGEYAVSAGRPPRRHVPIAPVFPGCPHCHDSERAQELVAKARAIHATSPVEARKLLEQAEQTVDPEPARVISGLWQDAIGDREQAGLWDWTTTSSV